VTRVAPRAAPVLWETQAGGWLLFGYEYLEGKPVSFEPGSPDLPRVVEILNLLARQPWPHHISRKPIAHRLGPFTPPGTDGMLNGTALAHTDLGEMNLLTTTQTMRVLDWALSCPAPAWTDAALIVPRLIAAGHTFAQADAIAKRVPAYRAAEPDLLSAFARTILTFWTHRTRTAPLPGRVKLTEAAEKWAEAAGR
jgi:hypothetical protein